MWLTNSDGYVSGCSFDSNLVQSPETIQLPPFFDRGLVDGADVQGGALHQEGTGLLQLQNTAFIGNQAWGGAAGRDGRNGEGRGGAVSTYGNVETDGCLFQGNISIGGTGGAFNGGQAFGGALYTTNTAALNHCLFAANSAEGGFGCNCGFGGVNGFSGGGAVFAQGALQILNTTFVSNWVGGGTVLWQLPQPESEQQCGRGLVQ